MCVERERELVSECDALCRRQLFRGVLKWGKAQLPRGSVDRKQLKRTVKMLLQHIRFPHMSQEEQAEAVKSGCVRGVCVDGGRMAVRFILTQYISVLPAKLMSEIVLAHAQQFDVRSLVVCLSLHFSHLCQAMEDTPRKRRRLGGVCNI